MLENTVSPFDWGCQSMFCNDNCTQLSTTEHPSLDPGETLYYCVCDNPSQWEYDCSAAMIVAADPTMKWLICQNNTCSGTCVPDALPHPSTYDTCRCQ